MLAIGGNVAFIGLMAAAGTPLIIAGGLDLSVAAIAGLTGVLIALASPQGCTIWLAVTIAFVLAALVGFVNGLFATRLRLNPLIVTLGMMSIVSGIALILTGGLTKPLMVAGFNWIGAGPSLRRAGPADPDAGHLSRLLDRARAARALAALSMPPAAMPKQAG